MIDANTAVQIYDRFIVLGKDIRTVLSPQYKPAGRALFKVVDLLLGANQSLLRWIHEFELFDFNVESKQEFTRFAQSFSLFRNGPDYDRIRIHCDETKAIYTNNLAGKIREWMTRDERKFGNAEHIFTELTHGDTAAMDLVNDIMGRLQNAIEKTKSDYEKGNSIQTQFLNDVGNITKKLEGQIDELRSLRREFLKLSGSIISI
jgi:hypothetical protein